MKTFRDQWKDQSAHFVTQAEVAAFLNLFYIGLGAVIATTLWLNFFIR